MAAHPDIPTLHALLDGALPAAEDAAVRAHLAGCAACAQQLEDERRWRGLMQLPAGGAVEAAAPGALERLISRAAPRRRDLLRHWTGPAAAALGLGVVLGLGVRAATQPAAPADAPPAALAADLDAWRTLAAEPWLRDAYDTVRALDVLLYAEGVP